MYFIGPDTIGASCMTHATFRAYPRGLGDSIHQVYTQQLQIPPTGDLRVRVAPNTKKGEVALFEEMEFGDSWAVADLKPVFEYLYGCKHTRRGVGKCCFDICRSIKSYMHGFGVLMKSIPLKDSL